MKFLVKAALVLAITFSASAASAEESYCPEAVSLQYQMSAFKDYNAQLFKLVSGKKITWTHASSKISFSYPAEWGYISGWTETNYCAGSDCKQGVRLIRGAFSNNEKVNVEIIPDNYQTPEGIDGDSITTYLSYPITAPFSDFGGFKQVGKITTKKYTAVILESTIEAGMTQFLKGDHVALVQYKDKKHSTIGFSAKKEVPLKTVRDLLGTIK